MSQTTNNNIDSLVALSPGHEPFYLVRSTLVGDDRQAIFRVLKEDKTFLKTLDDDGKLLFAGPLQTTNGGLTGEGLYVLKVGSLAEAQQIVERDPYHQLGIRQGEIIVWQRLKSISSWD